MRRYEMIFLGMDIGSSGCKCVAFSENGEQLSVNYKEYDAVAGHSDMYAGEMFDSVCNVIKGCTASLGSKSHDIAAISVTSFGESFVPIDKDGNYLSKIIMYTDKRGIAETDEIVNKVGFKRIMDITFTKPDQMYSLPKILWTLRNVQGVRDKVWKFLEMADFIAYKLSGETKINHSLAMRSMAFDLENKKWSEELLDAAGITSANMPEPVICGSIVGDILKTVAEELGLPLTTKIVISAHDQISGAIGAGVFSEGQATDGTGSVECITPVFKNIIRDHGFTERNYMVLPIADTGLYATYAFVFSGGVLLKWFRENIAHGYKERAETLGKNFYKMLDDLCPERITDIITIPHFLGCGGTPDMDPTAKGSITGLDMGSTLFDIYRSIMEGLTFEMRYNIDTMERYGIFIDKLHAIGGGAKSKIWQQIKADIFGKALVTSKTDEAGAAGCAMLAAIACGKFKDIEEAAQVFVKEDKTYYPNEKNKSIYDEKYEKFIKIRKGLLDIK
jgi:xylulokinase